MKMNTLKAVILMLGRTAFRMLIGYIIGGKIGVAFALFFTFVTNLGAYWYSDRIPLGMARAQLVHHDEFPQLYEMVASLSARMGLPNTPRIYLIDAPAPNAFATGRNPHHAAIAVTTGMIQTLTPHELEAILAHELFHIMQFDTLVAAVVSTLVGASTSLLDVLARIFATLGVMRSAHYAELMETRWIAPVSRALMGAGAVVAAVLFPFGISSEREFSADAESARVTGRPLALASGLEKLYVVSQRVKPLPVNPAIASLFIINPLTHSTHWIRLAGMYSTHPPLAERVARLETMLMACRDEPGNNAPALGDHELLAFPSIFEGGVQQLTV